MLAPPLKLLGGLAPLPPPPPLPTPMNDLQVWTYDLGTLTTCFLKGETHFTTEREKPRLTAI